MKVFLGLGVASHIVELDAHLQIGAAQLGKAMKGLLGGLERLFVIMVAEMRLDQQEVRIRVLGLQGDGAR